MKNKIFSNYRCVICNDVSHAEIADDFGNFSSKPFVYDEICQGYVCGNCREGYQDALSEFEESDILDDMEELYEFED